MIRAVRVSILTLAAGGLLAVMAADEQAVYRSDVSLVRVDAQVLDRNNRAISGLRAQDFILRDEGREQQIRNFASENMPLDVLLLLDVSASMRPHIERIASASHQALRVLRSQDRMGIMVFDRDTRTRLSFSSNPDDVEREMESLLDQETFRGGTDITRALLDAASYVQREARREARRAIIILTDDQTEFERNEAAVGRALTRADAVLCALLAPDAMHHLTGQPGGMGRGGGMGGGPLGGIILGGGGGPYGRGRGGVPGMRGPRTKSAGTASIAQSSGGDSLPVSDAYALESTLSRLRQRYALHFYLPAGVHAGEERHIEVDLTDAAHSRYPGAELRYRRFYVAPANGVYTAPAGGQSPVITRGGAGSSDGSVAQGARRRVAVDQDDSHQGPLTGSGDQSQPASPTPAPATASAPASAPAPADATQPAAPQQPKQGTWRKLKPGEQP